MRLFRIYFWPHRVLLLGPAFSPGLHQHRAAHWCYGLRGSLRVRGGAPMAWQAHRYFFVPPDTPHEVESASDHTVFLYLEPESREFAEATALLSRPDVIAAIEPNERWLSVLPKLSDAAATMEEADAVCRGLLGFAELVQHGPEQSLRRPINPLLERCLRQIQAGLGESLRLASLAASLGVSESWLMHRFTAEVGVPIRRYVLWQRLRRSIELALRGATLTEAAHAVGLSDGAHLSRTFKSAFGVTPSLLFARREQVIASFYDASVQFCQ